MDETPKDITALLNAASSDGEANTPEKLLERVGAELASGYQRIKIKIKPGKDTELVKAVRRDHPDIQLSVDNAQRLF